MKTSDTTPGYSLQSLQNRLFFFDRFSYICCVEGKDDEKFWEGYLEMLQTKFEKIEIISLGGKEEINKIINEIKQSTNQVDNIILATDKDYNEFLDSKIELNNILYTYGHSIENTLFCKESLKNIILNEFNILKNTFEAKEIKKQVDEYLENFNVIMKKSLILEVLNEKYAVSDFAYKGQKILDSSSELILENCLKKLNKNHENFVKILYETSFKEKDIEEMDIKLSNNNISKIIRGHFYESFMRRLLIKIVIDYKTKIKLKNKYFITKEEFYKKSLNGCQLCKEKCKEKTYYEVEVNRIKEILK